MSELQSKIKNFIVENFLFGNSDGLELETSFLDEGIIDSTGILELISFVEEEFNIQVNDDELIPENLDSIMRLSEFLRKKMQDLTADAAY